MTPIQSLALGTVSITAMVVAGQAAAETNEDTIEVLDLAATEMTVNATQDDEDDDVVVVRGFRGALADSLERKRDANQVLDSITSEEIGLFPDQNVAEALSRITGVQITRNNGEGETVSVRGLNPSFTRVEVDGRSSNVTIDSADPERQSVLSVFASDLYTNIEVIKSPTAADVEGGIGGIVRLNTPNPLDVGKLRWGVDAGAAKGDVRENWEPEVTGFYINTFNEGRVGLLLAGTYELDDRSIDKIQSTNGWSTLAGEFGDSEDDLMTFAALGLDPNARFMERLRYEQREGDSDKINLNGKVQIQATENLRLSADALYTIEERDEDRSRVQVDFTRSRIGNITGGTVDASGTITELSFDDRVRVEPRSFNRLADIETVGLTAGFEYDNDKWSVDGTTNFSSSEEDFTESRADARLSREAAGYSIVEDPQYPNLITMFPADSDIDFRRISFQQRVISIEETATELNLGYTFDDSLFDSVRGGIRYSSTEFDRKQGEVQGPTDGISYADGLPFVVDGSFAEDFRPSDFLTVWPSVDPVDLYQRFPSTDTFTFNDNNLYTIEENVLAGYLMGDFSGAMNESWNFRGNVGVRVVQTEYTGDGRFNVTLADGTPLPVADGAIPLEQEYTESLPSFNLVFTQGENSPVQFRFAAYRALSRPTISEINPATSINAEDGEISQGNPDLDPFTAWNYDAGVEWYFGGGGQSGLTATFFYKDVDDFIAQSEFDTTLGFDEFGIAPQDFRLSTFDNFGEATIQGVEIGFQTPFYFLPEFWSDFGIVANYTYTDSEATIGSIEDGVITSTTIDFPGASENSYNIVGYFERGGFSSRLAYNYRDEFVFVPATENARFGDSQGRLDLALRYRFDNGFRVAFDAQNLTEEQNFEYFDQNSRINALDVEGRIYSFRIGYNY